MVVNTLRCVAPAVMEAAAILMDEMVRECLSSLLSARRRPLHLLPEEEDEDDFGNEFRTWAWAQAVLPVESTHIVVKFCYRPHKVVK